MKVAPEDLKVANKIAKKKGRILMVVNTKEYQLILAVKKTAPLGEIRKVALKHINVPAAGTMMWWDNFFIKDSVTAQQVTEGNGGKIPEMKIYRVHEID